MVKLLYQQHSKNQNIFNFVSRIRKMASTRLGKEIEKNVFLFNITSVGQRKNCEFPWGIEPQTLEFCFPMLYHWAQETSWWARPLQSSQKICVLYSILLGSAMSMASCSVNRIRKLQCVIYELHIGPFSPQSFSGSVVEHRGVESEVLRFNSS